MNKNMLRKEKGVTMVILVITIIVILILAVSTILLGKDIIVNTNIENIATNILLIEAKVRTISEKIDFDSEATDLLKGREIVSEQDKDILEKLGITEIDSMKRILNESDFEGWGLQNIASDNKYLVDYKTCEIYYIPGVEDKNGNIVYKSTDIINKSEEIGE